MVTKRNYSTYSPEQEEGMDQMLLNGTKHQVEVLGWSVEAATKYAEKLGSIGCPLVKDYLENYQAKSRND